jgi:hypothetical protein
MTSLRFPFILLFPILTISNGRAQVHVGPGQAYPSIGAAASARVVYPGDTVFVHAGTYSDANTLIDSLIGTPDKWITIMPYQHDSVSIHVQYTFQAAQYLKVSGLNFYGNDRADSARIFHLLFFDYQYACFTSNHDIIVEKCLFSDLNNTGKGSTGACLKIDGTENFQVSNCTFRNGTNITDGISLNADLNGVIRNCTFENMPGDGSHCKGGAKNITYEKNLFVNCMADGVDVGGDTGPAYFCPTTATWEADSIKVYANVFIGGLTGIRLSSCHHAFIFNNTCFKTTQFAFRSLNTSSNGITLDSNYIFNNIFTTYSPYGIYMNASNSFNFNTEFFKNNLFHHYKNADPTVISWSEMPGVNVSGSIIGDPEFTDTSNMDGLFVLHTGSPAIGAAFPTLEPAMDFDGLSFLNAARSIGAFESPTAFVNPAPISKHGLQSYPNPFSQSTRIVFTTEDAGYADISAINLLGAEIAHIFDGELAPGEHRFSWDASGCAPGPYLCVVRMNGIVQRVPLIRLSEP